ncbi:Chitin deacetylase [Mycena indigotica]|uniref:chitin deacetylase n=1 Tax=Mycena indigotica TaxID=2126181 RepID=A0A8H6W732_9AGAR|nr:Chitin deacetylase [Mycena indigotica]KAF7301704.1 Chitin deacetylase [Mycena indigotica]
MFILSAFLLPLATSAHFLGRHDDAHSHSANKRLPDSWYQRDDHPVHGLFKRAPPTDGVNYPPVGSPTWSAAYPQGSPDPSKIPGEWRDALNAAVAAGKIPNIPQSSNTPGQNPTYPAGSNPNGDVVCSATYKCRNKNDIWDGPDGTIGISFDDGPQPVTDKLLSFLQTNHETATHFMIGVNILQFPNQFLSAFNMGGDIAVHTYTHPYMTTLSNEAIVAQLGWTMQLIHDSTGGRVPRFWRPPFGDSDNRVRAIAMEVFGMTTVIWNQDTEDWSLTTQGGTTLQAVNASMTQWINGPKSPGLIILEHELSDQSVGAFMSAYPLMKQKSWKTVSVAQLFNGLTPYQNSPGSNGPVTKAGILANNAASTNNTSNSAPAPSGSSTGSGSKPPSSSTGSTAPSRSPSPSPSPSQGPNAALTSSPMVHMTLLSILATLLFA